MSCSTPFHQRGIVVRMSSTPRATLGAYLDDADPTGALWSHLVDAVYRDSPRVPNLANLSPPARHLYLVGVLQGEVTMGGLSSFLSNSSGNHVPETFDALKALGAEAVHELLQRALAPFDGALPPRDREKRCEQLFAFEDRHPALLDELDAEFAELERELGGLKKAFMRRHAEAPVLDP